MPSFHSSRKDLSANCGRSREFVHAPKGPGMGPMVSLLARGFWPRRPALPEILYRVGFFIVFPKPLNTSVSALSLTPSSTWRLRSLSRSSCRGIPTGHASQHAPHSEEAKGRSLASLVPFSRGVMTAPIGPEYVEP